MNNIESFFYVLACGAGFLLWISILGINDYFREMEQPPKSRKMQDYHDED